MNLKKTVKILLYTTMCLVLITSIASTALLILNEADILEISLSGTLIGITIFLILIGMFCIKNKQTKTGVVTALTCICLMIASVLQALPYTSSLTSRIPDFREKSIVEVLTWGKENNITVTQIGDYSDYIEEYDVITQKVIYEKNKKDIKALQVIVSKGPNLEMLTTVENMVGWHIDDVLALIEEKKLSNVKIEFNFSEAEKDIAYEQSTYGEMKRNNEIVIKFSLGKEEDLKPVKMNDLTDKSEFIATTWLKRHGITYEISYEFDDNIKKGNVISTSIKAGKTVNQKTDTVNVVISKGKAIIVPDFSKKSSAEITQWAIENNLNISYGSQFDDSVKAGDVISVNVKKGDKLQEGDTIHIITSKGSLSMPDYTSVTQIRDFVTEYSLSYSESEEFSNDVNKGDIISASHKPGQKIKNGEEITVVISLGKKVSIPNFTGLTRSQAQQKCNEYKLTCSFSTAYDSDSTKDKVIRQNKSVGSSVSEGTNITLIISKGKAPVVVPPKPPVCEPKYFNFWIDPGLFGSTADQTISNLRNAWSSTYPGIKFNFVKKPSNIGANGMVHPDTTNSLEGTSISSCKTYTIYVIQN